MTPGSQSNEKIVEVGRLMEIAENHGIMIYVHPGGTDVVSVLAPQDQHYPEIHPNCYAPADLTQVYRLKGGGSGTAVFHGHSKELGSMVMKHGCSKDSREVFSLVTIRKELIKRGQEYPEAAEYMRVRIPEFVMVYISPHHVRDRQHELWAALRKDDLHKVPDQSISPEISQPRRSMSCNQHECAQQRRATLMQIRDKRRSRRLSIARGTKVYLDVCSKEFDFYIPGLQPEGTVDGGVQTLPLIGEKLADLQERNNWKVTLAQKMIGGDLSENGAVLLTNGKLQGELLTRLVEEVTQVMRNLEQLTIDGERGSIDRVRMELATLQKSQDVTKVSKELDLFVGTAITKNYLPGTGRFAKLREFGQRFRSFGSNSDFFLTKNEKIPAKFLGRILERGTSAHAIFSQSPFSQTALDVFEDRWLEVLDHALSFDSPSATARIWTCGLTDAGLHNTFISTTRGLELFDLGEPQLLPQPAFLTKFLMSFFHTLGMEDNGTGWVNRFSVVDGLVVLTPETRLKLPHAYLAHAAASDHFVKELFDGDERVRTLLLKYVVLQLLSDAAFCLERWETKGGGTERYGERVEMGYSQWLWRSLWDVYIASHINATLLDPSFVPHRRRSFKLSFKRARCMWGSLKKSMSTQFHQ